MSEIYLSGIQPSNDMHIGNYIGTILPYKHFLSQENRNFQFLLMIADLHALTTAKNANSLTNDVLNLFATCIACGINTDNAIIFRQSAVHAHTELSWILSSVTPIGMLFRMTQFKDKSQRNGIDDSNAGLLFYPILMAADILLYNASTIVVGDDQRQHIEFTRDIAEKFNNKYNYHFTLPKTLVKSEAKRVMSLTDGTKKMSKTDSNQNSFIKLTDSSDEIAKKIKSAKTDSIMGIYYDKMNRPEISNLLEIFSAFSNRTIEDVSSLYADKQTKHLKDNLSQLLIDKISPIRQSILQLLDNKDHLATVMQNGNHRANEIANINISKIKAATGLM